MASSTYYSNVREDVLSLLTVKKVDKALEIGGGDFRTLLTLRAGMEFETWGVDVRKPESDLDHFILGSIIDTKVHECIPDEAFDLILANDVIEHVVDTDRFVDVLASKLKKGGICAISVPNARQLRLAFHILFRGTFPREEAGLFDRTHVRWFCKRDVIDIFTHRGFHLVDMKSTGRLVPAAINRSRLVEFVALQNVFCFSK